MDIKVIDSKTGKFEEKELSPKKQEHLVGRHSSCDLILDSPDVSRLHGRFLCRQGKFYYNDFASTGGSWINNEAAIANTDYLLKSNDTLRLGSYLMVVSNVATAESSPNHAVTPSVNSQGNDQWWKKGELMVTCQKVIQETADVKTFIFTSDNGKLFSYKPGQFVTLNLDINGQSVKRSYSISSTPTRPYTLEITVKRVPAPEDDPSLPPGLVSNWLHDEIEPGSQISLNGPFGKFSCYDHKKEKLLLISAGSGITPMMSMSRWLLDQGSHTDMIFFHSARSPEDIIFKPELELLSAQHPNFQLAISMTRSQQGQPWMGYLGRLNEAMLKVIAPDFQERMVYMCGPDGFMKKVKSMFQELDFPMENFYEESFGAPKRKKQPVPETQSKATTPSATAESTPPLVKQAVDSTKPVVVFQKSQEELACEDEKSILELALESGIEIDYSCGSGACGTCQVKCVSGEYRYLQDPSYEADSGNILTCIATPVGTVKIDA
ncbi:MAG: FAD-binding oxidoreductase [Halothece sp. Uz-M2-17]|nr:FAD-binding oxidoreductase [Halothece sp. Uz-M2-17]